MRDGNEVISLTSLHDDCALYLNYYPYEYRVQYLYYFLRVDS